MHTLQGSAAGSSSSSSRKQHYRSYARNKMRLYFWNPFLALSSTTLLRLTMSPSHSNRHWIATAWIAAPAPSRMARRAEAFTHRSLTSSKQYSSDHQQSQAELCSGEEERTKHPTSTAISYGEESEQGRPTNGKRDNNGHEEDHDDSIANGVETRTTVNWRDDVTCNPTVHFKSWVVPTGKAIQAILNATILQPYLASRLPILDHLHVRFKIVRDHPTLDDVDDSNTTRPKKNTKLILLHPETPSFKDLPETVRNFLLEQQPQPHPSQVAVEIAEGPKVSVPFRYHQFTASFLLQQLLPLAVHPVPTSFETVGHVAHLNLRPMHLPYRYLIGQVLLETLPTIETVIHKTGDVAGPYRTYHLEVLAGRPETRVKLTESGVSLQFDLSRVYWCSRLSEERQRLLQHEILAVPKGSRREKHSDGVVVVADIFCGIGALCLQAAMAAAPNVEIWANDWNPDAIQALRENAIRNHVAHKFTRLQCGDSYDFLMDLGLAQQPPPPAQIVEDVPSNDDTTITSHKGRKKGIRPPRRSSEKSAAISSPLRLPDHVMMNFPLEAPRFLGALRWWPADTGTEPRVHVYTFARSIDSGIDSATPRSSEDVAVNLVADHLLPLGGVSTTISSSSSSSSSRREELNVDYGCNVKVHAVRDVAPGKVVFCVSFSATGKLLRYMRGDFD